MTKGYTIKLTGEESRVRACHIVTEAPDSGWECVVRPYQKPDRSTQQNKLQFKWAGEVAQQCHDRSVDEIQRDWKLRYGVPILRRDSEQFRETYDSLLKPRTFQEKMEAMHFISVSSLMTVKQMQEYLDTVQRENLQEGYRLTDPEMKAPNGDYNG